MLDIAKCIHILKENHHRNPVVEYLTALQHYNQFYGAHCTPILSTYSSVIKIYHRKDNIKINTSYAHHVAKPRLGTHFYLEKVLGLFLEKLQFVPAN